jgi:hypothetical protein
MRPLCSVREGKEGQEGSAQDRLKSTWNCHAGGGARQLVREGLGRLRQAAKRRGLACGA